MSPPAPLAIPTMPYCLSLSASSSRAVSISKTTSAGHAQVGQQEPSSLSEKQENKSN